jgi:hypothetical protein
MLSAATIQACDQFLEKPHVVFKIKDGVGVVWQVRHGGQVFFQSIEEDEARSFFDRMMNLGIRAAMGELFQGSGGI